MSEKISNAIKQRASRTMAGPMGRRPMSHFCEARRRRRCSRARTTMQPARARRMRTAATLRERKRPTSTEVIVETEMERGTLQKRRSTRERRRKPWRSVSHAARYPVQTVTGTKARVAARVVRICSAVMFVNRIQPPVKRAPGTWAEIAGRIDAVVFDHFRMTDKGFLAGLRGVIR